VDSGLDYARFGTTVVDTGNAVSADPEPEATATAN
jgi:hypothetical protein